MVQRETRPMVADGTTYHSVVLEALASRQHHLEQALSELRLGAGVVAEAAGYLVDALRAGHKILAAGNGGSAAQAQHFAAELVGRFKLERGAYAALSLTTDTSILTAVGNDYGYADVFARQIFGIGLSGDVLLLFSTSGDSENLVRAAVAARQRQMPVIAVTGRPACRLERLADLTICTASDESALAQETHLLVVHILCEIVEAELAAGEGDR